MFPRKAISRNCLVAERILDPRARRVKNYLKKMLNHAFKFVGPRAARPHTPHSGVIFSILHSHFSIAIIPRAHPATHFRHPSRGRERPRRSGPAAVARPEQLQAL